MALITRIDRSNPVLSYLRLAAAVLLVALGCFAPPPVVSAQTPVPPQAETAAPQAASAPAVAPARMYVDFTLAVCDEVEATLDAKIIPLAEIIAQRHLDGGVIGFPWNGQAVQQELHGRSGNMMHIGFGREWSKERTPEQDAQNVVIISFEKDKPLDFRQLKKHHEQGHMIVAFGPKDDPKLAEAAELVDVWFDSTGRFGDHAITLPDGQSAGNPHLMRNVLAAWALQAEIIGALTRHGKLPVMWKSFSYPDGRDWMDIYFRKTQFHDDYQTPPLEKGQLARQFLDGIRDHVLRFEETEFDDIQRAADLVAAEVNAGKTVPTAAIGHMPWTYVGFGSDARWTKLLNFHGNAPHQMEAFSNGVNQGELVVVLGYAGLHHPAVERLKQHEQRTIMISTPNQQPDYRIPRDLPIEVYIDMGYAFGDAMVELPGYPIKVMPPSGVMQLVAYEALSAEVLARLGAGDDRGIE